MPSPRDAARWQELSPHLDRALELSGPERAAYLGELAASDAGLATDLSALLADHESLRGESFLESGAAAARPAASLAGSVVGAYTLRELIGQGGMGSVWLGERSDGRFAGTAAVKLLNASLLGEEGQERFRREGSILARLRHPNIARLLDAGVSSHGHPYLVIEHVDGEPIDHWCDARELGIEARVRVFLDVLEAVAHAHANLVVHRDIKPSNVLVAADGRVKLLDFGIAKLLSPEADGGGALTRDGRAAFTPDYAAPEQFTGEDINTATDVYALGVLLYVMLTGAHPVRAPSRSPADVMRAILETDPMLASDVVTAGGPASAAAAGLATRRGTTPERLRTQLRGDLDNIVAKALERRPEERYASAEAMAEDLRRWLEHRPVRARAGTLSYRAAKFVRRNRRPLAAAAAAVLLIAALVSFYTVRLARERDRARNEAARAKETSALLTDLLAGPDPYASAAGGEVTLRAVLEQGTRRVERELAAQTALQAEMLGVMGRTYQRLGEPDRAAALLERALAIGRRAPDLEGEHLAAILNDLGALRGESGDYAAAQPLLEEALARRRSVLGPEHPDVAATLVELGRVHADRGMPRRAEPLLRESLAIRRRALGEWDRQIATSASDLGLVLRQLGDLPAAEEQLRSALAISRRALGPSHPDVGTALGNVALIAGERGDHAAAEALTREALAIARRALGERHPDIAYKLANLAQPLREQGKHAEAAAAAGEALAIARAAVGDDHPLVAHCATTLARVHLGRGEAAAAEPLLREALRLRASALGEGDWRVAATASLLGEALAGLGRRAEAEALLSGAARTLRQVPGPQGREAAANDRRLAALRTRGATP